MGRIPKSKSIQRSYRGITWITDVELSIKLGHNQYYVGICRSRGKSYEEIIDSHLGYEYRGLTWKTDKELSIKLGRHMSYISNCVKRGKRREDIIDRILDQNIEKEYRGVRWITNAGLSIQLGKKPTYVSTNRSRGKSYEEIIDHVLDNINHVRNKYKPMEYRGFRWTSDVDLGRQLNMHNNYICRNRSRGKTYEQIIDHVLSKKHNK